MGTEASRGVGRRSALRLGSAAAVGAVGGAVLFTSTASAAPTRYNPITPYRSVDTRLIGPDAKLRADHVSDWDLITNLHSQPIITDPTVAAVTFNLTVTETEAQGFLAVFPANASWPGISSINWSTAGIDLANGGTVALGHSGFAGAGSVTVLCGGTFGVRTHYIIDVTGYYAA